jgi:hypothetical protein
MNMESFRTEESDCSKEIVDLERKINFIQRSKD